MDCFRLCFDWSGLFGFRPRGQNAQEKSSLEALHALDVPFPIPNAAMEHFVKPAEVLGFSLECSVGWRGDGTWDVQGSEAALRVVQARLHLSSLQTKQEELLQSLLSGEFSLQDGSIECSRGPVRRLIWQKLHSDNLQQVPLRKWRCGEIGFACEVAYEACAISHSKFSNLGRLGSMSRTSRYFDANSLSFEPQISIQNCHSLRSHVDPCNMVFGIFEEAAWSTLPQDVLSDPQDRAAFSRAADDYVESLPPMRFDIDGEAAWHLMPIDVIKKDIHCSTGLPSTLGVISDFRLPWLTIISRSRHLFEKSRKGRQRQVLRFQEAMRQRRHSCCEHGCEHGPEESCSRWAKLYDYHGSLGPRGRTFFTEVMPHESDKKWMHVRRLRHRLWIQWKQRVKMHIGAQLVVFPIDGHWPELEGAADCNERKMQKLQSLERLHRRRAQRRQRCSITGKTRVGSLFFLGHQAQQRKHSSIGLCQGVRQLPECLRILIHKFWRPYCATPHYPGHVLCPSALMWSLARGQFWSARLKSRSVMVRAQTRSYRWQVFSMTGLPYCPLGVQSYELRSLVYAWKIATQSSRWGAPGRCRSMLLGPGASNLALHMQRSEFKRFCQRNIPRAENATRRWGPNDANTWLSKAIRGKRHSGIVSVCSEIPSITDFGVPAPVGLRALAGGA